LNGSRGGGAPFEKEKIGSFREEATNFDVTGLAFRGKKIGERREAADVASGQPQAEKGGEAYSHTNKTFGVVCKGKRGPDHRRNLRSSANRVRKRD